MCCPFIYLIPAFACKQKWLWQWLGFSLLHIIVILYFLSRVVFVRLQLNGWSNRSCNVCVGCRVIFDCNLSFTCSTAQLDSCSNHANSVSGPCDHEALCVPCTCAEWVGQLFIECQSDSIAPPHPECQCVRQRTITHGPLNSFPSPLPKAWQVRSPINLLFMQITVGRQEKPDCQSVFSAALSFLHWPDIVNVQKKRFSRTVAHSHNQKTAKAAFLTWLVSGKVKLHCRLVCWVPFRS